MKVARILAIAAMVLGVLPGSGFAHCDSMNGPVILDARKALEAKNVTPVLKWLKPEYEAEAQRVFAQTLEVRQQGGAAALVADRYFFETVVRLHRMGEGEAYTGVKDADVPIDPGIASADEALRSGTIKDLARRLTVELQENLHHKFERAHTLRQRSDNSVEAGREYVGAYVEYIHFVEGLARIIKAEHHATEDHVR